MFKVLCLVAVSTLTLAAQIDKRRMPVKTKKNTLINKEEVDDIKNKTWLWTPYDADENPLNDKTDEELMGIIGGYKDEEDVPLISGSDADN